ncbi:unnamed protein product [Dibothriocephalus latus]|uniref:Reverse transcriptase domain-containing protein n=1 Tax=Dibothriocephalus latus TaxID=60516 RepID=A0A3P6TJX6_DIBLA|nr:unnamed protein product [Dibothriocephalus latus]
MQSSSGLFQNFDKYVYSTGPCLESVLEVGGEGEIGGDIDRKRDGNCTQTSLDVNVAVSAGDDDFGGGNGGFECEFDFRLTSKTPPVPAIACLSFSRSPFIGAVAKDDDADDFGGFECEIEFALIPKLPHVPAIVFSPSPRSPVVPSGFSAPRAYDVVRGDSATLDLSTFDICAQSPRVGTRDALETAANAHVGRSTRHFPCSVPQGSVLSPTLFNIYMRDLLLPQAPAKVVSYADNITFYCWYHHMVVDQYIEQAAQLLSNFMPDIANFFAQRGG